MTDNDFYEEDEPIEELLAEFDAGEQGVTTGPSTTATGAVTFTRNYFFPTVGEEPAP